MPISPPLSCDWPNIILALETIPQRIKFSHKTPLKCWQRKGLPEDSPSEDRWLSIFWIPLRFFGFYPISLCLSLNTLFWMWIEIILFRAEICLYLQNNFFRMNYNQENQLANMRVQQDGGIQSKKIQQVS